MSNKEAIDILNAIPINENALEDKGIKNTTEVYEAIRTAISALVKIDDLIDFYKNRIAI